MHGNHLHAYFPDTRYKNRPRRPTQTRDPTERHHVNLEAIAFKLRLKEMMELEFDTQEQQLAKIYVALAMMRKIAEEAPDQAETMRSVLSLIEVASNILEQVLVSNPLDHVPVSLDQPEIEFLM